MRPKRAGRIASGSNDCEVGVEAVAELDQAEEHEQEQRRAQSKLDQGLTALGTLEPAHDTEWSFIHASSQLERR